MSTDSSPTPRRRRPWTRAGAAVLVSHVFYELAAGVALPLASRLGPAPAAGLFATGTVVAVREAGRQPPSRDALFCALNGLYLSAVAAHFVSQPRRAGTRVPWLEECEGLRGRLVVLYNLVLHASAIAAVGGLVENRRGRAWGALVPAVAVPVLVHEMPRELARLREQAQQRPGWWNRRLRP